MHLPVHDCRIHVAGRSRRRFPVHSAHKWRTDSCRWVAAAVSDQIWHQQPIVRIAVTSPWGSSRRWRASMSLLLLTNRRRRVEGGGGGGREKSTRAFQRITSQRGFYSGKCVGLREITELISISRLKLVRLSHSYWRGSASSRNVRNVDFTSIIIIDGTITFHV